MKTKLEPFPQDITRFKSVSPRLRYCTYCEKIASLRLVEKHHDYSMLRYFCNDHIDRVDNPSSYDKKVALGSATTEREDTR